MNNNRKENDRHAPETAPGIKQLKPRGAGVVVSCMSALEMGIFGSQCAKE